jgi:hypothetical protein
VTSPLYGWTPQAGNRLLLGPGVLYEKYGLPGERQLGATRGGTQFNPGVAWRTIEADVPYGNIAGMRVLDDNSPTISTGLLEWSEENLLIAMPGLRSAAGAVTESVQAAYVGTGNGAVTAFNVGATNIVASTLRVYTDAGAGNPTLVPATSYTLTPATGAIVFTVAPASGAVLTASYSRTTGGAATHNDLTQDDLMASDYLTNVALCASITGKVQPVIIILHKALGEMTGDVSLTNKGEAVMPVRFSGFYDPDNLAQAPFTIKFPNS